MRRSNGPTEASSVRLSVGMNKISREEEEEKKAARRAGEKERSARMEAAVRGNGEMSDLIFLIKY